MKALSFHITGNPVSLARARMGKGRMWDSQKQEKLIFGIKLLEQLKEQTSEDFEPLDCPLSVDIYFFFQMPQYHYKKWDKLRNTSHHYKPDIDNCIKFLLDASTGVLFKHDACVSEVFARKIYADEPCTRFTVRQIK